MKNTTTIVKIVVFGIFIVQLLDIIIHAATHQLEPLRVSSNIIILLWLAIMTSGEIKEKSQLMAVVSIAAYTILNLIFLAINGVTNAEQGGELRVVLFVLIFITVAASSLLAYMRGKPR